MNAHRIPRIGLARAGGEHLKAANDAPPFPHPWEGEGRGCPACLAATRLVVARVVGVVLFVAAWTALYFVLTA